MIKYPASYARMRGLKGKLIGKAQLEGFLGASDIQAVTSVLNNTVYGEQIRGAVDLQQIEHGLKQELIVSYMKILTFLRGKPAHLFKTLMGEFELLNVKSIVRSFAREPRTEDSVEPFIFSLGKYHILPVEKALEASDFDGFMAIAAKTPFARPLEIGYQQYQDTGEIFPMELALDLDYYDRLWQALDSLGLMDKHNAMKLLGTRFDVLNLLWVLRFKKNYDLSPEQIFQYITPHGWKLGREVLRKAAESADVREAIKAIQVSPYDDLLKDANEVDGSLILGVELRLLRYLYQESLGVLLEFPLQASLLIAFFILKEMEIKDIVTVLAGRHMSLSPERIRSYMVTL